MSILIKGIDMPKEGRLKIEITSDGLVWIDKGGEFYAHKDYAIQIPMPHGRLVDADKIFTYGHWEEQAVSEAPTILEAEE